MKKDYIHDIQKENELKNCTIFSFLRNDEQEREIAYIKNGIALDLVNALGNALLKESFQRFEK